MEFSSHKKSSNKESANKDVDDSERSRIQALKLEIYTIVIANGDLDPLFRPYRETLSRIRAYREQHHDDPEKTLAADEVLKEVLESYSRVHMPSWRSFL